MKLILFLFLVPVFAIAQIFSGDTDQSVNNVLRQEGQLLSVQLVLGEPIKIFVVGKEEAKIDLNELELTVRRMKPYPGKTLNVTRYGNYFILSDIVDFKKVTDLEVTTKVKNKTEHLNFKIENKAP